MQLQATDDRLDRVVVVLGAAAGLAGQEMIEWSAAAELLVLGNGGTTRMVWAAADVVDARVGPPYRNGPVPATTRSISGLRYRIARLAERAGMIAKARPKKGTQKHSSTMGLHQLRHRIGTDVVRTLGIEAGRMALRHTSVVTTQRNAKGTEQQVVTFIREPRRG